MSNKAVEEFARLLVEQVRDRSIRNCDLNLRVDAKSTTAKRWRDAGVVDGPAVNTLIPECVDAAIYFLLAAVDDGVLRLRFEASDGTVIDLGEDGLGELAGWFIGADGWREAYSAQRKPDLE